MPMDHETTVAELPRQLSTGIVGLDSVLRGGLPEGHVFLVCGDSGSGKTTLGLQFLLEGIKSGETCLYVTVSESESDLREVAASHGWSLDKLAIYEWRRPTDTVISEEDYSFFPTFEVESNIAIKNLKDLLERLKPKRIVIDTLSDLRLVSREPLYYRRQMIILKTIWSSIPATVLLLDQTTGMESELRIESLVQGVMLLGHDASSYGPDYRYILIKKMRGIDVSTGFHGFAIKKGGIRVYPRLQTHGLRRTIPAVLVKTGVDSLDLMLNGGLCRGTTSLIVGPSGVGKSTLACLPTMTMLRRGEKAAVYLFEESSATYLRRGHGLGLDMEPYLDSGHLTLQEISPSRFSVDEFLNLIRDAVLLDHVQTIVIDSLDGYLQTFQVAKSLILQMHEILAFLNENEILTLLITGNHGPIGAQLREPSDILISYLSDLIILLRYFEVEGGIRKAISILKNRVGPHDQSIRELCLKDGFGLIVGAVLENFQGVLTGVPFRADRPVAKVESIVYDHQ